MIKREIFEDYARLKVIEKQTKEQLDLLKENIMTQMQTFDEDQIELKELGTFIKVRRKFWKYTKAVDEAATALKEVKAEEEAKGTATYEVNESFMFRAMKI